MHHNTKLACADEVEVLFGQRITELSGEPSLGLCQEHYQKLYAELHPPLLCDSCGARAKLGEELTRHCPVINSHMESVPVSYAMPAIQILQLKVQQEVEATSVERAIERISQKTESIHVQQPCDYFELALCAVAQKMAEAMKNAEAMLLPAIHREFSI